MMKLRKVMLILIAMLLLSQSWAAFSIRNLDIYINIDEKGIGHIEENIYILIKGDLDLGRYTTNLEEKNLYVWSKLINDTEVRTHIDPNYCIIKNLKVRPQPPQSYNALTKTAVGVIRIAYDVYPIEGENGTGVVEVSTIKPRVKEYSFNRKILSLPRTISGNLILDERTNLYIQLPKEANIKEVNPDPYKVEKGINTLMWRDTILVDFTLKYEIEETLYEEVSSFFNQTTNRIKFYVLTKEGMVTMGLVILIVSFYIYLKIFMVKRKLKKGRGHE